MRPNGRRRWRKWAKKQRAWSRGITGERPSEVRFKKFVRSPPELYQGQLLYLEPEQLAAPLPATPFAARSLVGMTQGAKKQAGRRDALAFLLEHSARPWRETDVLGELFHDPACYLYPRNVDDSLRRLVEYNDATPEAIHYHISDQGIKYRIGERLRPCPGCANCLCPCHLCRKEHGEMPDCQGTGLLPARKARKARG